MLLTLSLALVVSMQTSQPDESLLTVAEASNYTATSTSAQVMELIERIRGRSAIMRLAEMGKTSEGKPIPLVILANPPIELDPTGGASSEALNGRAVCFIMANIHAGEVEGKEASLELIRKIALTPLPHHPLLKNLVIIFAPNYNADGNDKLDAVEKNRPGQVGPAHCGIRANAQGLDLNRDYIKLEAPESQALVKFFTGWDPHLTIDCHTTNGSHHRYTLTYEAPLNPSSHPAPIEFVRHQLLPEVTKRIKEKTGYDMWHYGNFSTDHTVWETYSAMPRFGGPYQGLRNQMSILSEAYSYAPYKDRIIATREFIRESLNYAAEHREELISVCQRARRETIEKGTNPHPDDVVGIRHRIAAFAEPVLVKGYERASGGDGGAAIIEHDDLGPPRDYLCVHRGRFEPTLSVVLPYAYIIPPLQEVGMEKVIQKLREHGIVVESIEGSAMCEQYMIKEVKRAEREFQGHREVTLEVQAKRERIEMPSGSHIVRTAQPLGTLAVYLLEPQSEDGLATWNFFDDHIAVGKQFPVLRVRAAEDISP